MTLIQLDYWHWLSSKGIFLVAALVLLLLYPFSAVLFAIKKQRNVWLWLLVGCLPYAWPAYILFCLTDLYSPFVVIDFRQAVIVSVVWILIGLICLVRALCLPNSSKQMGEAALPMPLPPENREESHKP